MPGLFLILAGLFTIVAAVLNWDWFMNSYRAAFFVKLFGRDGARVFYAILGMILVIAGILSFFFGSSSMRLR